MNRLTDKDLLESNYDPWELCGMDGVCTKGCHDEGGCTKGCHILKMYKKLADYEDLEEQGKLIKLPCKVGDTVWFITSAFSTAAFPIEAKVTFIRFLNCDNDVVYLTITKRNGADRGFKSSDIGKTIFLTKEEAEAALKKMEEGNE